MAVDREFLTQRLQIARAFLSLPAFILRAMSSSSKPLRSGLGSLRRDWSQSSQQPQSSQEVAIPWEPTQKPKKEEARPLTGTEKRLRDIQRALEEIQNNKPAAPLAPSRVPNKRPSNEGVEAGATGAKKRRVLPWENDAMSSKSGFGNDSIAQSDNRRSRSIKPTPAPVAPSSSTTPTASNGKSSKVAAVFLSQEQTHILQLAQEGNSLFYTGSAGEYSCHIRFPATSLKAN